MCLSSGGSRIFERGAGIKRHRRKDRGAVGAEGVGCGDGVPPSPIRVGSSPEHFWTFYLEIALFGAFLGVFKVYIPIFACHFCNRKGDWYDGTWT